VQDLRIGKHMLDIRFWREGQRTAFDVIKGDPKLVERRDIATEGLGLRTTSDSIQRARTSPERSKKKWPQTASNAASSVSIALAIYTAKLAYLGVRELHKAFGKGRARRRPD
jgi:hypothetical protein